MAALEVVLVGAGNRGRHTFGAYAREFPERLRIVAVAEPQEERRAALGDEHGLPPERRFADWRELFARPRLADSAIVATSDTEHVEPALEALERGYDVLLEKPIAPAAADCVRVVEAAERFGRALQICHPLRYTPFYDRVGQILESGALGDLVTLDLEEHVAYWHMTHSYVRGKFRKRALAAPILLAKSCHDLDLMTWFARSQAARVASFGSLRHFRAEHAPPGAPERCSDGCPVQADCIHDAVSWYGGPDEPIARSWPWSELTPDPSREARLRALETGPYGLCVYRCDNDVPDRQIVAVEFASGVTGSFTLNGLGSNESRTLRITGTRGELRGVLDRGLIEVSRHGAFGTERFELEQGPLGHFGGDRGLLDHFTADASGEPRASRTSGRVSLESHLIGFAAEEARLGGHVADMAGFRERAHAQAAVRQPAGDET
jgi:predicted dehydrogenase